RAAARGQAGRHHRLPAAGRDRARGRRRRPRLRDEDGPRRHPRRSHPDGDGREHGAPRREARALGPFRWVGSPDGPAQAARAPGDGFDGLPGYRFEPRYVEVEGLRMHRVDEGGGPPVLLLHGEPTWSFLYRHMVPVLTSAGLRAIAPDYFGFGRSDKPTDRA